MDTKQIALLVVCLLHACAARPRQQQQRQQQQGIESDVIDLMRAYNEPDNQQEITNDIMEKIKQINEKIIKIKRQQNNNNRIEDQNHYALNEETMKKLLELLEQGDVKLSIGRSSKAFGAAENDQYVGYPAMSYAALLPYYAMPPLLLQTDHPAPYARQTPSLPFQIPWPLAPFFPILIKDPLLTFIQGGNFNNLFEYGQNADVCSKHHAKSGRAELLSDDETTLEQNEGQGEEPFARQSRAIKKRTVQHYSQQQDIKLPKKISNNKIVKRRPIVEAATSTHENSDGKGDEDGDLRIPFGDFGWFGNKKPVAPSPGFFINRLKVRSGGVAIAGPGGVATAGRGGTALVGPGGLAYTQPGGLAVAGPAARVVAISEDTDMGDVISRLLRAQNDTGTPARKMDPLPEGKVVARGPVLSSPVMIANVLPDVYMVDVRTEGALAVMMPTAESMAGAGGVSLALPQSHVFVGKHTTVVHRPTALAVAGAAGIAHAQADLYVYTLATMADNRSVTYIPYYGGAKGHYLEVNKSTDGEVIAERMVPADGYRKSGVKQGLTGLKKHAAEVIELLGDIQQSTKLNGVATTAADLVKLIQRIEKDDFEEDVGEEGIGVDGAEVGFDDDHNLETILSGSMVADARPVGVSVVGGNGVASSRPLGTALVANGVAIARPVATAIAGIDPASLGLHINLSQAQH